MSGRRLGISFIGAGAVGGTLSRALALAGHRIVALCCRSAARATDAATFAGAGAALTDPVAATAGADVVFVATPDDALAGVAAALAASGAANQTALYVHASGFHGREVLAPLAGRGARTASLHPLQTFPGPESGLARLPGTFWGCEADCEDAAVLEGIVADLGGRLLVLKAGAKRLYHGAAVMACNYLVALQASALSMMEAAGVRSAEALQALLPLVRGTVDNLAALGSPAAALTGPIARGDVATVAGHLDALRGRLGHLAPLYTALGRATVRLAQVKGTLGDEGAVRILEVLDRADRP